MTKLARAGAMSLAAAGGLAGAMFGASPAGAITTTSTNDVGSVVSVLQTGSSSIDRHDGLYAVSPQVDSTVRPSR